MVSNPDIPFALMAGDPGLSKALVAEQGTSTSAIGGEGSPWVRAAGPFFGDLGVFLRAVRPHERHLDSKAENRLCRFCFVLGLYDEISRTRGAWSGTPLLGLSPGATTDELLSLCTPVVAADLSAMVNAFIGSPPQLVKGNAVLNPGFAYLGGADGDLIVDGCYIDIKATRDPKRPSPSEWPWEILGDALLDRDDRYAIRSVALYLARQSLLVTWLLEDFSRMLAGDGPQLAVGAARQALQSWLAA